MKKIISEGTKEYLNILKMAYDNFITLGTKKDIELYKRMDRHDKSLFKHILYYNGVTPRYKYEPLIIRLFVVTIILSLLIQGLLQNFFHTFNGLLLLLNVSFSLFVGFLYKKKQSEFLLKEFQKIDEEKEIHQKQTISINGVQSEVYEDEVIKAIENSNVESILPYKKQIPYYKKLTKKEDKDRLIMVFVSALVTSHNIRWPEIYGFSREQYIKEFEDNQKSNSDNK